MKTLGAPNEPLQNMESFAPQLIGLDVDHNPSPLHLTPLRHGLRNR